jgi:hypothetical protein
VASSLAQNRHSSTPDIAHDPQELTAALRRGRPVRAGRLRDRCGRGSVRVHPATRHPTRRHRRDPVGVRPTRHPLRLRRGLHQRARRRPRPPVRLLLTVQQAYKVASITLPPHLPGPVPRRQPGPRHHPTAPRRPGVRPRRGRHHDRPRPRRHYLGSGLVIDAPTTDQTVHIGPLRPNGAAATWPSSAESPERCRFSLNWAVSHELGGILGGSAICVRHRAECFPIKESTTEAFVSEESVPST